MSHVGHVFWGERSHLPSTIWFDEAVLGHKNTLCGIRKRVMNISFFY
jgi:hypothetical protein